VNGCIGLGRKVGGEQWLGDFIQRLGTLLAQGSCLGKSTSTVSEPVPSPAAATTHPRVRSPRAWISTKVALAKAGLVPASCVAPSGAHILRSSPRRPNRLGPQPELCNKAATDHKLLSLSQTQYWSATMKAKSSCSPARCVLALRRTHVRMFGR